MVERGRAVKEVEVGDGAILWTAYVKIDLKFNNIS